MKDLKEMYNYYLSRYYAGVNYIEEHPEQINKYIGNVSEFLENANILLVEIMKEEVVSEKQILEGF